MNYIEFAKAIKEKYPEYEDMSDLELVKAIVEKYPDAYSDVTFEVPGAPEDEPLKRSPLNPMERIKMGFGDSEGNFEFLKNKYGEENVQPYKNSFIVKTDKGWQETDPTGTISDMPMDVLEILAPTAVDTAAQLSGAALGALAGNVPGAIAGGAGGAAVGDAINQGIGNVLGTRQGYDTKEGLISAVLGGGIPALKPAAGAAKNAILYGLSKGYEKVGRPVLNALSKPLFRLPIETIEQAVKPTSKALDMNAADTQDALRNLTKQVGSKFDAIKDTAQEDIVKVMNSIQKNSKGMPLEAELQPKVKQADLLKTLEDLYYGASFSNDPSATRYFKADKYRQNIADWLDELADANHEISAPKLYDVMNRIKGDVKWNATSENEDAANQFLRRLYGAYSEKLKETVPRLKKPFKEFKDLMDLRDSEGVKQILQPLEADRTSQAASALKNQGRIITQGEARNNLKKLEDLFVKNNFNGFMDAVDDINAAQELNKTLMTGDSGWQGFLRETLGRAGMSGARKFNRSELGKKIMQKGEIKPPSALNRAYQSVIYGLANRKNKPTMLYGGVSNTVPADEYNNYDMSQY